MYTVVRLCISDLVNTRRMQGFLHDKNKIENNK